MADDSVSKPLNPLLQRKFLRDASKSLHPQLETIATEFVDTVEPLRLAMNEMIEAGPNDWAEVLYKAGPLLPAIEIPPWENATGGNVALTRKGLLEMVLAARADNRSEFENWHKLLMDDPDTASRLHSGYHNVERPIGELPGLACHLLHFSCNRVAEKIRPRFQSLIEGAGIAWIDSPYEQSIWAHFSKANIELSPVANLILKFCIDSFGALLWPTGQGRTIPPIGYVEPETESVPTPLVDEPPVINLAELSDVAFVKELYKVIRMLGEEVRSFRSLTLSHNLKGERYKRTLVVIQNSTEAVTRFAGPRLQSLMDGNGISAEFGNWQAAFRMEVHYESIFAGELDQYLNALYRREKAVWTLGEQLRDNSQTPIVNELSDLTSQNSIADQLIIAKVGNDDIARKVMKILEDPDVSTNDKLFAAESIGLIDYDKTTSVKLGKLFNVTDAAIRKTDWWDKRKADKPKVTDRRKGGKKIYDKNSPDDY